MLPASPPVKPASFGQTPQHRACKTPVDGILDHVVLPEACVPDHASIDPLADETSLTQDDFSNQRKPLFGGRVEDCQWRVLFSRRFLRQRDWDNEKRRHKKGSAG